MRITRSTAVLVSSAAVGAVFFATPAFGASAACTGNLTARHMHAVRAGEPPVLPTSSGQMRESVESLRQYRDTPAIKATLKATVKTIYKALQAATAEHAKPEKVVLLVNQAKAELDQLAQKTASLAPNTASQVPHQTTLASPTDSVSGAIDALKAALDALVQAVTTQTQDQTQLTLAIQNVVKAVTDLLNALGVPISSLPVLPGLSDSPSAPSASTSTSVLQQPQVSGQANGQMNGEFPNVPASPGSSDSPSVPSASTSTSTSSIGNSQALLPAEG